MPRRPLRVGFWIMFGLWMGIQVTPATADDITLNYGLTLQGTASKVGGMTLTTAKTNAFGLKSTPILEFWMIDDNMRRYFTFRRDVKGVTEQADLGAVVSFKMPQERKARTHGFPLVGSFGSIQPFDEFGRRTVTLGTSKEMVPIIQAITEIRPDYSRIESLTHLWEYNVDTRTLPPDVIHSIIEKTSNRADPAERKAAVTFYVKAQNYELANQELEQIAMRFPDLKEWCDGYRQQLDELVARRAINEVERRQQSGQHQLAIYFARQIQGENVSAGIKGQAHDLLSDYEQALADRDRIVMQLDMLQAKLPQEQAQRLTSMKATLQDELQFELMNRLDPFLRTVDDETLPPDQKLALAYSGWLLGNNLAITDLNEAIRLWDARFQVLEYLRVDGDPSRDKQILNTLNTMESINVERIATMIPTLPMAVETTPVEPGKAFEVDTRDPDPDNPVRYTVTLPPEYSPAHKYPLIVTLKNIGMSYDNAVRFWAGNEEQQGWAQRRGYIVIAPHYAAEDARSYGYSSAEHDVVMKSINHVRKRYRVDSDRIFLTGHGMGGSACIDIAMSHPGVFAGAIPFCGAGSPLARLYRKNEKQLPWYFVAGERDRNLLELNITFLNEMMRDWQSVLYCEYKARGFEMYPEEQERIFEWMQLRVRTPLKQLTEWTGGTLRRTDHRFFWAEANGIPETSLPPLNLNSANTQLPRMRTFSAAIKPDIKVNGKPDAKPYSKIIIKQPGDQTTLWLSPDLYDFQQQCIVEVNQKQVFKDYLKPSLEALLTELRLRGDRERLYWVRLDL